MSAEPVLGPDRKPRCPWALSGPEMLAYHDQEWGRPVQDDQRLFEKLSLEGFQAGLSWRTVLLKRESFREVFFDFDFERVARFREKDILRLLQDPRIIRHRGKIEAVIHNAHRAKDLVKQEGSLAAFVWRYAPGSSTLPTSRTTSPEAIQFSKDLRKRGFKFVGPTTAYAFMQAMGLVNDHLEHCAARARVERERRGQMRKVRPRPEG